MKDKFQFVSWWPEWRGIGFKRANIYRLIYKWFLVLGFWEIRKWNNDPEEAKKKLLEKN